jgi:tetratricopeptide (TPR) repeat protein
VDGDQETALRPLRGEGALLASLRSGSLPESGLPSAVVRVADAVEGSLRRLLRDFPGAAMEVRLRALAPDELTLDEVLAELRQHDRLSIGLAAVIHDLDRVRRRLVAGGPYEPSDAERALRAADGLEHEVARLAALPHPPPPAEPPPVDETLVEPVPVESAPRRRRARRIALAAGSIVLLLLNAGGAWWASERRSDQLDQGIALFRDGSYMDAASHFWRYAEAHPDDPTPHVYLARIHRRLRRFDLAAQEVKRAVQIAPDDADVLAEMGFLLLDTGRRPQAIDRFRDALRSDPESREAWVGLILALRESGQTEAAERVLERAPAEVRALASRRPAADSLPRP